MHLRQYYFQTKIQIQKFFLTCTAVLLFVITICFYPLNYLIYDVFRHLDWSTMEVSDNYHKAYSAIRVRSISRSQWIFFFTFKKVKNRIIDLRSKKTIFSLFFIFSIFSFLPSFCRFLRAFYFFSNIFSVCFFACIYSIQYPRTVFCYKNNQFPNF
jgi:hypothetical protein